MRPQEIPNRILSQTPKNRTREQPGSYFPILILQRGKSEGTGMAKRTVREYEVKDARNPNSRSLRGRSSFLVGAVLGPMACVRFPALWRTARNVTRAPQTLTRRALLARSTPSRTQVTVFAEAAQVFLGILAFHRRQTAALPIALGRSNIGRHRRPGAR